MDVRSNQRWFTVSTMTSGHHFYSAVPQNCPNLAQLQRCNGVRVHWYAYVPHWKMLKHFIYVQYGCEKLSKVVYRLNHDIMASFPINSHPELPKSDKSLVVQLCKGPLICLHTSLTDAKTLYTCSMWIGEVIKGGLQPQPYHHCIISTQQSPRIDIIWPISGVTV